MINQVKILKMPEMPAPEIQTKGPGEYDVSYSYSQRQVEEYGRRMNIYGQLRANAELRQFDTAGFVDEQLVQLLMDLRLRILTTQGTVIRANNDVDRGLLMRLDSVLGVENKTF